MMLGYLHKEMHCKMQDISDHQCMHLPDLCESAQLTHFSFRFPRPETSQWSDLPPLPRNALMVCPDVLSPEEQVRLMQKKKPLKRASEFFQYLHTKMNCQHQLSTFMVFYKLGMLVLRHKSKIQIKGGCCCRSLMIFCPHWSTSLTVRTSIQGQESDCSWIVGIWSIIRQWLPNFQAVTRRSLLSLACLHGSAEKVENSPSNNESHQVWQHCKHQRLHRSVAGALSWRCHKAPNLLEEISVHPFMLLPSS